MTLYLILALIAALIIFIIAAYNRLVKARQMSHNGWADIDVQLKRRADLIPALVNTVQGYAGHEKTLFADIAERRSRALAAGDNPGARANAEGALGKGAGKLIALAEDYPDLKANTNFLELQNELSETENKIEYARRFYNGAVRELNTMIESFPLNLIAGGFGFARREYFEINDSDRAVPVVGADDV